VNKDKEEQPNSSPSTSTSEQGNYITLEGDEILYLVTLPEELAAQLTTTEAVMLVRLEPAEWPQSLRDKMLPYAEGDLLEELEALSPDTPTD
jgi:hypothetical protein